MPLNYQQPLYRPPSEADNLILQITTGCHFNQCSFCSMYKDKTYRLKTDAEIQHDIAIASADWPDASRIFLADGDVFNLPAATLLKLLNWLQQAFPSLKRVSSYATPANIVAKTADELAALKQNKLSLLYVGIESGNDELLKIISKGASKNSIERALWLAHDAEIKVSAMVILGLGGKSFSAQHITDTVDLLNRAPLTYLSTLQLYLDAKSETEFFSRFKPAFEAQTDQEILGELQTLLTQVDPVRPVIFRSNHASNALPLAGNLPRDKPRLLQEIELAQEARARLRSAQQRHL